MWLSCGRKDVIGDIVWYFLLVVVVKWMCCGRVWDLTVIWVIVVLLVIVADTWLFLSGLVIASFGRCVDYILA